MEIKKALVRYYEKMGKKKEKIMKHLLVRNPAETALKETF